MTNRKQSILRSILPIMGAALLGFGFAAPASAEDWAFRRSYYSHALTPEVAAVTPEPHYRSAYRVPRKDLYPGYSFRSTFRMNRIQLQSGFSRDSQTIYQGSVEFRP